MRKSFLFLSALLLATVDISAQTVAIGEILYTIENDSVASAEIDEFASGDIVVPATITYAGKNYTVENVRGAEGNEQITSLDIQCRGYVRYFSDCTALKSVKIGSGITTLEGKAFNGCTALTNVELSEGLITLGGFSNCPISEIKIPNSVKCISGAFCYTNIKEITIHQNIRYMSGCFNRAALERVEYLATQCDSTINKQGVSYWSGSNFDYCDSLKTVYIGSNVKVIPTNDYQYSGLEQIIIPAENSLTTINTSFYGTPYRDSLMSNENSMIFIGDVLFAYNGTLPENTTLVIPEGTKTIERRAFSEQTGIVAVTLPSSLKRIGDYAFEGCTFGSVTIPQNVEHIGKHALPELKELVINAKKCKWHNRYFSKLSSVTFGNEVEHLHDSLFRGCSGIRDIDLSKTNIKTVPRRIFEDCSRLSNIKLPDSTRCIKKSAFEGCGSLQNIVLPTSLDSICDNAFNGCVGITEITLPQSLTFLGGGSLQGTSIREITLPENIKYLGNTFADECLQLETVNYNITLNTNNNFYYIPYVKNFNIGDKVKYLPGQIFRNSTNLNYIIIPENVDSVHCEFLCRMYDNRIDNLYCKRKTPPSVSTPYGEKYYYADTLYVPLESLELYKNTAYWKNFATILPALDIEQDSVSIIAEEDTIINIGKITIAGKEAGLKIYSDNDSVATVDEFGKITGVGGGQTLIWATDEHGNKDSVVVNVTRLAQELLLSENYLSIQAWSEEVPLTATILPHDTNNKNIEWTLSDEQGEYPVNIRTEGNICYIYGNNDGQATITARSTDGSNLSASCQITVWGAYFYTPHSIYFTEQEITMSPNEEREVSVRIINETDYSDASEIYYTEFYSSNDSVVTVGINSGWLSKATLTAVGAGKAEITAQCYELGISATMSVTVEGSTGICPTDSDNWIEYKNGCIIIYADSEGENISVQNIAGVTIDSRLSSIGKNKIGITEKGIYIIRFGNRVRKIII